MDRYAIDMPATLRLLLPTPPERNRQSVYVFGMYRSGSSVLEAVADVLARLSGLTPLNVGQIVDINHVELQDIGEYSRSSVFLGDGAIDKICSYGGNLFYGFREIPKSFGDSFSFNGSSVLLVRDPRDILMSQYKAVAKHSTENASGQHIMQLQKNTANMAQEDYVTSEHAIAFAKRICDCYSHPIEKGIKVLRFEDYATPDKGFDLAALTRDVHAAVEPFLKMSTPLEQVQESVLLAASRSESLKQHSTGMRTQAYRSLSEEAQERLTEQLESQLALLGYE